jgi:hypothetical protein
MIGTVRSFLLGIIIGWPSRVVWLLRHKVEPLQELQRQAEGDQVRKRDMAYRPRNHRMTACGASGVAYRF